MRHSRPTEFVERAIIRQTEVLLNIARLIMVEQVGHLQATKELNAMTVEFEVERIFDFGVEANERGEPARLRCAGQRSSS